MIIIKNNKTIVNDKEIIISEYVSRGFLVLAQERLNQELQDQFYEHEVDVNLDYLKKFKKLNAKNIAETKIKLLICSQNKILSNVFKKSIKSYDIENEKINLGIKKIEDEFVRLLDKAIQQMSYIVSN